MADDAAGVIEYSVRGTFLHVAPTVDSRAACTGGAWAARSWLVTPLVAAPVLTTNAPG